MQFLFERCGKMNIIKMSCLCELLLKRRSKARDSSLNEPSQTPESLLINKDFRQDDQQIRPKGESLSNMLSFDPEPRSLLPPVGLCCALEHIWRGEVEGGVVGRAFSR